MMFLKLSALSRLRASDIRITREIDDIMNFVASLDELSPLDIELI